METIKLHLKLVISVEIAAIFVLISFSSSPLQIIRCFQIVSVLFAHYNLIKYLFKHS